LTKRWNLTVKGEGKIMMGWWKRVEKRKEGFTREGTA